MYIRVAHAIISCAAAAARYTAADADRRPALCHHDILKNSCLDIHQCSASDSLAATTFWSSTPSSPSGGLSGRIPSRRHHGRRRSCLRLHLQDGLLRRPVRHAGLFFFFFQDEDPSS